MADFIAGAISRPGALKQKLGVPAGKTIPGAKLKSAENAKSPLERKEADFAVELKGFKKPKKMANMAHPGIARGFSM